uniref:Secreted protein n=1 Tax=Bionectria ochroleuca TaxID=29856 RepID=A0A8H7NMY4_BIOOC
MNKIRRLVLHVFLPRMRFIILLSSYTSEEILEMSGTFSYVNGRISNRVLQLILSVVLTAKSETVVPVYSNQIFRLRKLPLPRRGFYYTIGFTSVGIQRA